MIQLTYNQYIALCIVGTGIAFIVFIVFCFTIVGASSLESGVYYNRLTGVTYICM